MIAWLQSVECVLGGLVMLRCTRSMRLVGPFAAVAVCIAPFALQTATQAKAAGPGFTLRMLAAKWNLPIGSTVNSMAFTNQGDPTYKATLSSEFSSATPESALRVGERRLRTRRRRPG